MKNQKTGLTTIVSIVFFYFLFSLLNYSYITEDAFIYFRFAENLVAGYGYVFNIGERVGGWLNPGERIEACSSVTWLFLLTFFRSLGFNILTISKILGILFGCTSLFFIFQITKHFTVKMPWVILPPLLTSFSLPFNMWNQMGLETSLYTLVLLILVFICLNNVFFICWPIIALILILTRPEGAFLLLGLIPALYFKKEKKVILPILLFVILCMIVVLIRLIYFHDFLPSPFFVKMHEEKYLSGFKYIHLYCKDNYIYYLGAPLICILLQKFNWQKERIILFGFIVVYIAWIILGGSEPNPFYRHVVPLIPLLYIYLITGIEQVIGKFTSIKKILIGVYITVFCIGTLFFPADSLRGNSFENPIAAKMKYFINNPSGYLNFCSKRLQNPKEFNYVGASKSRQLLLGEFIKRNYPSGTTLLYDQMGRAPYQAGIDYYFIDSWGLTDKKIGRYYFQERVQATHLEFFESIISNLIKKYFPQTEFIDSRIEAVNYILRQRKTDVIMVIAPLQWDKTHLPFWLINDKRFRKIYERKYLIESTVVFEKRTFFGKRRLNIPDGLSITYNKDIIITKALDKLRNNKPADSLKSQIDYAISKHKNALRGEDILEGEDNRPIEEAVYQKDTDEDGVKDVFDNCPLIANPNQEDVDEDKIGDACDKCIDSDWDGYGYPGFSISCVEDNCPYTFNPDQEDGDEDGIGDACEPLGFEEHRLEAEHADTIVSPLEVADDKNASKGKYIYAADGTDDQYTPSSIMAIYKVNISQPGAYILRGQVIASNKKDNSFFVQIDTGLDNLWEVETGDHWHWDEVNNRDGADPIKFILTEGVHTIKVKLRENGTKLDKLVLTNRITFKPTNQMN